MLRVLAPNRTRAAAAGDARRWSERRDLAIEIHWHVQGVGLRMERHRTPTLEPGRARAEIELDANLRNLPGAVRHFARMRIDVDDVLVAEVGRLDERAGLAIELPNDPELSHLEERLTPADVDQDVLEHFIHVHGLARDVLVVPLHFSRVGIKSESGIGIERGAVGASCRSGPWLGLRGAPIDKVRGRIVTAGNPRVAAGTKRERKVAPRITARLARS